MCDVEQRYEVVSVLQWYIGTSERCEDSDFVGCRVVWTGNFATDVSVNAI